MLDEARETRYWTSLLKTKRPKLCELGRLLDSPPPKSAPKNHANVPIERLFKIAHYRIIFIRA